VFDFSPKREELMMRWMLGALAWMLVCGMGVCQAAPLTFTRTQNLRGIFFIGQDVFTSIDFASNRPAGDTTLDVIFRGDYDDADEFASISLEGTPVGEAGTTLDGSFLGTNVTNHGPDDISFTRSFVINQKDMVDAIQGNGFASILFHHSNNFSVGENTRITVTYTTTAVPEPSTLMLTSLGLVCAGFYRLRRRRAADPDGADPECKIVQRPMKA
jgi:hypothetical protein